MGLAKIMNIGASATDELEKPSYDVNIKPTSTTVPEAPKKQELVYFSSRSRHMKIKTKDIAPKAKEVSPTSRLSTVASLVSVAHKMNPNRKERQPSTESSTTVYGTIGGSVSTGTTAIGPHSDEEAEERDQFSPHESISRLSISTSESSDWWDEQKIRETMTSEFVTKNIQNISETLMNQLQAPVSFGNGLTNTTYIEWILQRARKFFLILLEIGILEQIFTIIDNSWDDNDLPMNTEAIEQLSLANPRDISLEKKFYKTQHHYNLRFVLQNGHTDFEDQELVPLDVFREKSSKTPSLHSTSDKVSQPRQKSQLYIRRRIPIGADPGATTPEDMMEEIEEMRAITHHHIVNLFASYTHKGYGFFLLSPPAEITLKHFINTPPPAYKKLAEDVRRFKLLDWMHCLADALAYLYDRGVPHQDIRPKSIVFDEKSGRIMFSDIGSFRRMDPHGKYSGRDYTEFYTYSAPELWQRGIQLNVNLNARPTATALGGSRTGRRPSKVELEEKAEASPEQQEGVHVVKTGTTKGIIKVGEWVSKPAAKSDVFSLGCVFLEMLTFHSKKKTLSQFASHRAKKHRAAGSRGGGCPDPSYHASLDAVSTWIKALKKEAVDRDDDAVQTSLILCSNMLQHNPEARPTPREVCDRLFAVMKTVRMLHCEIHFGPSEETNSFSNWSGWDDQHEYGQSDSVSYRSQGRAMSISSMSSDGSSTRSPPPLSTRLSQGRSPHGSISISPTSLG